MIRDRTNCGLLLRFQQTELNIVGARITGGQYLIHIDPLGGIVARVARRTIAGVTVVTGV